jgi:hypothetical protein
MMSRAEAKRRFTVADHAAATAGIECRKDADVIDETPAAYKPIDAVMAAQADLVDVVHTLRQVVCVKGCGARSSRRPPCSRSTALTAKAAARSSARRWRWRSPPARASPSATSAPGGPSPASCGNT